MLQKEEMNKLYNRAKVNEVKTYKILKSCCKSVTQVAESISWKPIHFHVLFILSQVGSFIEKFKQHVQKNTCHPLQI